MLGRSSGNQIGCLPTQALAFLAVFVYATHATQAIAFESKPGLTYQRRFRSKRSLHVSFANRGSRLMFHFLLVDLCQSVKVLTKVT